MDGEQLPDMGTARFMKDEVAEVRYGSTVYISSKPHRQYSYRVP